jgi:hypothetical protein
MSESQLFDQYMSMANPLTGAASGGPLAGLSAWGVAGGLLFGIIGWIMFRQGKNEGEMLTILCGLGLMVYPMLVYDVVWIFVIGAALTAIPFVVSRLSGPA